MTPVFSSLSSSQNPINDIDAHYVDVPLFVAADKLVSPSSSPSTKSLLDDLDDPTPTPATTTAAGERRYIYMGQYTQSRYSDKLSTADMNKLPRSVLAHWASTIASDAKPAWLLEALLPLHEPKPDLDIPDGEPRKATERRMRAYRREYAQWKQRASSAINAMSADDVLAWFQRADADLPAGLRLNWEYLVCTGYDRRFYQCLVTKIREEAAQPQPLVSISKPATLQSGDEAPEFVDDYEYEDGSASDAESSDASTVKPSESTSSDIANSAPVASASDTGILVDMSEPAPQESALDLLAPKEEAKDKAGLSLE